MTGQELFEALSFVDEGYIAEAETAVLSRRIPWMKWASLAACLCILLTGFYGYRLVQPKGAAESAAAPAATYPADAPAAAAPESAVADGAPAEEAITEECPTMTDEALSETMAGVPETIPGELHHVAFAQLRILKVLEDGSFEVYVERVADEPGPIEAGATMTLVIDPEMIPAPDRTNREYPGDVTVDMLVEIQNGTYDAGINTLYAEGVLAAAQE